MRVREPQRRFRAGRWIATLAGLAVVAVFMALWLAAAPLAPGVQAASFTVNLLTDAPDLGDTNGNGAFDAGETAGGGAAGCDTDAVTAGNQCTLRAAIYEANRNGDTADTITFGPLSGTINSASSLPVGDSDPSVAGADGLANNTTIDGNGSVTVHGGLPCLKVTSASNTIRDLTITGCNVGVFIDGEAADGNAVRGNTVFDNGNGVAVAGGADSNTVGGTTAADRNIIRDNAFFGVFIFDAGTTGNVVAGNCIGTLADCSSPAPNGYDGVAIDWDTSSNTVGGTEPGAANVIAYNGANGVYINGGTSQVVTRNVMFSNTDLGIRSPVPPPTLTGCSDAGGGNVSCTGSAAGAGVIVEVYRANVDASGPEGELFLCSAVAGGGGAWSCIFPNPGGGSATATQRDPGGANNTSSFAAAVDIPAGPTYRVNTTNDVDDGICNSAHCSLREAINAANLHPGADTIGFNIVGCPPGCTITPASPLPTLTEDGTTINGGTQPGYSGTPLVTLDGASQSPAGDALQVSGASFSAVIGLRIQNFAGSGIAIQSSWSDVSDNNVVSHNLVAHALVGIVVLAQGPNSTANGNAITSNILDSNEDGISVGASSSGLARDNTIDANTITGSDREGLSLGAFDGSQLIANVVSNNTIANSGFRGLVLTANNALSMPAAVASNFIWGNTITGNGHLQLPGGGGGLFLMAANGSSNNGNLIEGNTVIQNIGRGIHIQAVAEATSSGNTVRDNTIALNSGDGVQVYGAIGDAITANSIHSNSGKGIDLLNGGNIELRPPVIDTVAGSVSGHTDPKCYPCIVEVFSDNEDEGRIYHGSTTTNDDATGTWTYLGAVAGPNITATITDASGNTSEFSAPFALGGGNVDCDEDVDAVDALFILQYVVGLRDCADLCPIDPGTLLCSAADVTCDGTIDAVDALFVLQCVVGLRPCEFQCSGP